MEQRRKLELTFHGRVIDHLGIQMYQSPVAAIAETIANAWDADATVVKVFVPDELGPDATFVIEDDGRGMTFEECQERFLNVGYNRRLADHSAETTGGRPVMGRKGIGKFAGFGIADLVDVETVSEKTGEQTRFRLDLARLRGESGTYVEDAPTVIPGVGFEGPDAARKLNHGTRITLRALSLRRRPPLEQFKRSMARRFLLLGRADDFKVYVNDEELREYEDVEKFEFVFPRDYGEDSPEGLTLLEDGWGEEEIEAGKRVRWRIGFYPETIKEEEFRGIAVFAHGKLAQAPFFFELSGGSFGQAGEQYLTGAVEADFLDELDEDLIATERQRINWSHPASAPLREWGEKRVRDLLRLWSARRAMERRKAIDQRLVGFHQRLERLPTSERKIIRSALGDLAEIDALSEPQFNELGTAVVTTWEGGRLKGLIESLAQASQMSEDELADVLSEQRVLTAIHMAEAVKSRTMLIDGLRERLSHQDLEEVVRVYVAENPWLVSPNWETLAVDSELTGVAAGRSLGNGASDLALVLRGEERVVVLIFKALGSELGAGDLSDARDRVLAVDLALGDAAGHQMSAHLIVESLQAGGVDGAAPDLEFEVIDWASLLDRASSEWHGFLRLLASRAPSDERLAAFLTPGAPNGD